MTPLKEQNLRAVMPLPEHHACPEEPFFLVCLKPPSMAHAFLMADRVAVYELAKHGRFRYRANVDLEDALQFNIYASAPKAVQQALKAGQSFTYGLFTSGAKWFTSARRPETNRTNLALEAYREEYGQILFVTPDEAERRSWDRIPERVRSLVTPMLEDAVKRHVMVQARCLQLH